MFLLPPLLPCRYGQGREAKKHRRDLPQNLPPFPLCSAIAAAADRGFLSRLPPLERDGRSREREKEKKTKYTSGLGNIFARVTSVLLTFVEVLLDKT